MRGVIGAALLRGLLLVVLWWVLAEGDVRFWHYGLGAVALATVLSLRVLPPAPPRSGRRPWEAPLLAAWFLGSVVRGGIDVARRAVDPRLTISPHLVRVPIRTASPAGRRLALWMINLMPGSLVVREDEDSADLHILAEDLDAERSWDELERRIGRIVGG